MMAAHDAGEPAGYADLMTLDQAASATPLPNSQAA